MSFLRNALGTLFVALSLFGVLWTIGAALGVVAIGFRMMCGC